ncbi:hypothetical protein SCALIN_C17_0128 [Candidatus Scalindua japonica]|uniref:Small basic protein n=1 Tax=Candidatus Scalindua japonica TaxID=1284222 RepID=A0A286TYZ8_9BACT|nr:small basic protein [Candidatus Scalindua japonica]GAX61094.1 hypothetical protein SCALIN_C17_0128 [Candidatus Scalindua japonica]
MSIDKSLVSKSKLGRHRNVLTRTERIKILEEDGSWNEKKSVYGLPKVKSMKVTVKKKVKKVAEVADGKEKAS